MASTSSPKWLAPNFAGIPEELKTIPAWVCWQPKLKNGKWTKVPRDAKTGGAAKVDDPATWSTFEDAANYYAQHKLNGYGGGVAGVGIVLQATNGIAGIDIDHCIDETGAFNPLSVGIIEQVKSYTEKSPSGTGVRIFLYGGFPGPDFKNSKTGVELYTSGRYLTVTGHKIADEPEYCAINHREEEVAQVYHQFKTGQEKKTEAKRQPNMGGCSLSDRDLLDMASANAKNGRDFARLWAGDHSAYGSQSEADLALCNALAFWTNRDHDRIDRLFRQSGLFRPKWDEKHNAAGQTYGDSTIERAIAGTANGYDPKGKATSTERERPPKDDSVLEIRAKEILDAETPCDDFDTKELPPTIAAYIDEICRTTEADPITVTMSVYGTLGAILGKRVYIEEGDYFQKLFPNLWALVISTSGSFKTTALKKGGKIAFESEKIVRDQVDAIKKDLREKQFKMKDKEFGAYKLEKMEEIKELEKQSSVLPTKVTAEALLQVLADGKGGCIYASEFGDWLETLEKTHNTGLKALFTDLYDVPKTYSYLTKTSGQFWVEQPFISIAGVSTIEWVKKSVRPDDVSSGFFARFLLFYPPKKDAVPPALPRWKAKDYAAENRIKAILQSVPDDMPMTLTEEGTRVFEAAHALLYSEVKALGERPQEILSPYLKRWSPYLLKLAMVNQVFLDPTSTKIGVDALKSAFAILEYAIKSTTYLFRGELGESEHQRKCRAILKFLAKKGGKSRRQVILSSKTLDGGVKDYDEILEMLTEQGEINVDNIGPTGAPIKRNDWIYYLNPQDGES